MFRRRFRKRSYRRRKTYRRRRSLRRKVASINRRLAAEVKKNDNCTYVTGAQFQQLTGVGIYDYAFLYPVIDDTMKPGVQLDDINGEMIKLKSLYLGLHLQQACDVTNANQVPVTLRVMVIQDRNFKHYNNAIPTMQDMFKNLFGFGGNATPNGYVQYIDSTILPLNPMEPGRFKILRDFRLRTSPTGSPDVVKRLRILQSQCNSHGKIYFGPANTTVYPIGIDRPSGAAAEFYFVIYPQGTVLPSIVIGTQTINPTTYQDGDNQVYPAYSLSTAGVIGQDIMSRFLALYPGGAIDTASDSDPANRDIVYTTSRNGIYVLFLFQGTPTGTTGAPTATTVPTFGLSIQSRLSYYDN